MKSNGRGTQHRVRGDRGTPESVLYTLINKFTSETCKPAQRHAIISIPGIRGVNLGPHSDRSVVPARIAHFYAMQSRTLTKNVTNTLFRRPRPCRPKSRIMFTTDPDSSGATPRVTQGVTAEVLQQRPEMLQHSSIKGRQTAMSVSEDNGETVHFVIPVAGPDTPISDHLQCPSLAVRRGSGMEASCGETHFTFETSSPNVPAQDELRPRDSPFVSHNHWGGGRVIGFSSAEYRRVTLCTHLKHLLSHHTYPAGFVDNLDRVALNTLHLAGGGSAGVP